MAGDACIGYAVSHAYWDQGWLSYLSRSINTLKCVEYVGDGVGGLQYRIDGVARLRVLQYTVLLDGIHKKIGKRASKSLRHY